MSAATLTRETGAAVRPARVRLTQPMAQPSTQASPRRRPARLATASSVRACSVPRAASGPSDASLLAIMVAVALVFLFGLVVLVQGLWAVSQPTEAPAAQPVVVGQP
ncbi:hypothetical protein [Aestuariimicrobium sp. Y1814]|uniref:hypothetical protein n=1 Tax=Aestuariimicrobium sp. Y1814 TaxID=3418742 RepID=UPI003DA7706E